MSDSADFKSVTAACPAGKQLVGTGAQITGGFGEVGIDDLRPNGSPTTAPTAVTVGAREIDAFTGNWSVTAFAICANPLPGLMQAPEQSLRNSDFKIVTAKCPTGKQLVGTGAEITGGFGKVIVDDLIPNGSPTVAPTAVTVGAREADGYTSNWSVTAYAICANPLPGLSRHENTSLINSADFKDVTAECPDNKRMTGLGAEIVGGRGDVTFDDLRPNGSTTTAPTSNTVRAHEEDPIDRDWWVTAYAICANT